MRQVLKDQGLMMLTVANLCSEAGFDRFKKQSVYKPAGFYFMSPDIITQLVTRAGFSVVQMRHSEPGDNLYFSRDICILIRKS